MIEDVRLQVGQTRTLDIRGLKSARSRKESTSRPLPILPTAVPPMRAQSLTRLRSRICPTMAATGQVSLCSLPSLRMTEAAISARSALRARARDDNNFQFDGVDAGGIQEQAQKSQTRLQISQDAIAEYRVSSALYDAEYGTQAGGQVDVVTKSGTNDFHGSLFGYLRNSIFDARNFNDFDINGNPAIPPFRFGQYGLSLGGPVVKNKLFFFLNYEGLRQYAAQTTQVAVPSPSIQQTTLAHRRKCVPFLQAFPWRASTGSIGNCNPRFVFPDGAFADQTSQGLPDSDLFTNPAPTTVHEDTWLVRMDYKISDKTTLYGRAQRDISLVSGTNGSACSFRPDSNHQPSRELSRRLAADSFSPASERGQGLRQSGSFYQSPGGPS